MSQILELEVVEEEIRKYFTYDKRTGKLIRKSKQNKQLPDRKPNKTRDGKEYISYSFNCRGKARSVYAHIIVHFIVIGSWVPDGLCIDHRDGDGTNNKWKNLRVVTLTKNQLNRHKTKNKSGYVGVHWEPRCQKWYGKISVGKQIYTRVCDTPEEARDLRKLMMEQIDG